MNKEFYAECPQCQGPVPVLGRLAEGPPAEWETSVQPERLPFSAVSSLFCDACKAYTVVVSWSVAPREGSMLARVDKVLNAQQGKRA